MLTMRQAEIVGNCYRNDDGRGGAVSGIVIPHTPPACELLVANAIRDLRSGFVRLDSLRTMSRGIDAWVVIMLELVCLDIQTTLTRLNTCSVEFSRLQTQHDRRDVRFWKRTHPTRHGSDAVSRQQNGDQLGDRSAEPPHETSEPSHCQAGSIRHQLLPLRSARTDSKPQGLWVRPMASATLDLIAVNYALEALSHSTYPWGAPNSFKEACCRLCGALVALDECLSAAGI
jgi:hypothetical protein